MTHRKIDLAQICSEYGLRMTRSRQVIVDVISASDDHPSVETIYERARKIDQKMAMATVYRTVSLLNEVGVLDKHDFGDGKARFELTPEAHHDHLIDVRTGKVVEFVDPELEQLQKDIAKRLGYKLVDHRMELFGVMKDS